MNDFDMNGHYPIKYFTKTIDGKDVPVFLKRELTDADSVFKKRKLKHHELCKKNYSNLFKPDIDKICNSKTF